MEMHKNKIVFGVFILLEYLITSVTSGISPIHDFKLKANAKLSSERLLLSSPHNALIHLDTSILKSTKNVTQNPQMEETLYQISKDLVSAILSKLEIQDKITRITSEALDASGKSKGITAIETRRILDYISRTLSGHILTITRASTEPELHRLVYGLAQIAAETSIVSALKDITYATALSKRQSVDLNLRKKRSIETPPRQSANDPVRPEVVYNAILHKNNPISEKISSSVVPPIQQEPGIHPYSVFNHKEKKPLEVVSSNQVMSEVHGGFLNQTALDIENLERNASNVEPILMENAQNGTTYVVSEPQTSNAQELNTLGLNDEWLDNKDKIYRSGISPDVIAEMEMEQTDLEDEGNNEKKTKLKLERLESKAKKALLYAGDVAFLTAASVVAMRRALTASIEVQMSIKFASNGMSNHQELMLNLAKTAAQQAGKEAKSAASKSLACERVIKLALKYTAQSKGAVLNHVANRVVMDSLSLATLAKSMAYVSSDIAINSLYLATEIKSSA